MSEFNNVKGRMEVYKKKLEELMNVAKMIVEQKYFEKYKLQRSLIFDSN